MITATFTFRDNNGREAETRVWLRGFSGIGAATPFALSLAGAMSAISDAVIVTMTLSEKFATGTDGPGPPGSDVKRDALLFYRNGLDCASIRVPSPAVLLAETSGFYAGIRITRERLGLLALLETVEALPDGLLDPVGRPYGTTFTVGGIT